MAGLIFGFSCLCTNLFTPHCHRINDIPHTHKRCTNERDKMSDDEEISVYDEVEIEDMTYDEALQIYHYPCPCGDRFSIALADLQDESTDIAVCPSCSLMIRVIYDLVSVQSCPHEYACSRTGATEEARGRLVPWRWSRVA